MRYDMRQFGEGLIMEFRQLGGSGLKVPALSLGTGTFGGKGELFKAWGGSTVAEATRLIDICLDAGLNMFDTADIYSDGLSEEILGRRSRGGASRSSSRPRRRFRPGRGRTTSVRRATICCARATRA